jgi:hypothetical protein
MYPKYSVRKAHYVRLFLWGEKLKHIFIATLTTDIGQRFLHDHIFTLHPRKKGYLQVLLTRTFFVGVFGTTVKPHRADIGHGQVQRLQRCACSDASVSEHSIETAEKL